MSSIDVNHMSANQTVYTQKRWFGLSTPKTTTAK
jgi:hypothetical protein